MGAVALKTLASLRQRRLQAAAIGTVLLLASAAGTLALAVLNESSSPFERAQAATNGAHLVIDYDGMTDRRLLEATAKAAPVVAVAGPWPILTGSLARADGGFLEGTKFSGRPSGTETIDRITQAAGRWWTGAGEAVLDEATARVLDKHVGDNVMAYPSASYAPGDGSVDAGAGISLTVVGIATSVSTPDVAVWLSPHDLAALSGDVVPDQEMLYRVAPADKPSDLDAAMAAIVAKLPPSAVVATKSYLNTSASVSRIAELYAPVLLTFALFALLAAAFAIANIVSGIVLSSSRDIGLMRMVGFTPSQAAASLVGQVLVPALIGTAVGVTLGVMAALPIIGNLAASFGLPADLGSLPVIACAVSGLALATVVLAAGVPAWRAGRVSPVSAMGGASRFATGSVSAAIRRRVLSLPLPLPVRLGLSSAIARPGRAAMTVGALIVGVIAVVFSIGLNLSLLRVQEAIHRTETSPIRIERADTATGSADFSTELAGMPQTAHVVGLAQREVTVPLAGAVPFVGYREDASWLGYEMVRGRWFARAGEAVAPSNFYKVTGLKVGDTTTITLAGRSATIELVGETFEPVTGAANGLLLRGEFTDLAGIAPATQLSQWEVQPANGVNLNDYLRRLERQLGPEASVSFESDSSGDRSFTLFLTVVSLLGLVLITISVGGVFNSVLLESRQRAHELAVLKALGLSPAGVITMVVASIVPLGLLAGVLGVPLGLAAQNFVLGYMADVTVKSGIPPWILDVFGPVSLAALALSGLAVGAAGAYLPALRAASAPIAIVLQAE